MVKKKIWLLLAVLLTSCTTIPFDIDEILPTDWASQICPTCEGECATCEPLPTTALATSTSFFKTNTSTPPLSETSLYTDTPGLTETYTAVPTDTVEGTSIATGTFTKTAESTSTSTKTSTPTSTKTNTPKPTYTNTSIPTKTYTVAPDEKDFQVQPNSPVYLQNFAHADQRCTWMGVAGQAFDISGDPIHNVVIIVEGFLGDDYIEEISLTGISTPYGPGGYEVVLDNQLVSSEESLYIQLYNLAGEELTNEFYFDTYADCSKNLIIINFQQISE